jgi:hypothetical protein
MTMAAGELVLRDIHAPLQPPWWPPAPGWWLLAGAVVLLALAVAVIRWRRQRLRQRVEQAFDQAIGAARTPVEAVAVMSELLRRAARRRHARAAVLPASEWLALLDEGAGEPVFQGPLGELLVDGGYRTEIDTSALDELRDAARARFVLWMCARG